MWPIFFMPFLSATFSWRIAHRSPFVCSIILLILLYRLTFSLLPFISSRRSLYPTLPLPRAGYFSSRNQSSCDWSTHLFCIRVPQEQTIVLTPPIKLMTVIKNNTSIISALDISNGRQVILNGSYSVFLVHTLKYCTHRQYQESKKLFKCQFMT